MAYGVKATNSRGTTVIGENVVPMMVRENFSQSVSRINPIGDIRIYSPPRFDNHMPMFQLTSSINRFGMQSKSNPSDDNYHCTLSEWFDFNDSGNLGSVEFRYLVLGDAVSYPSGGYGLEVRDSSGKLTYSSNGLLLDTRNIKYFNKGDTVSIPNGKWICPLIWYFEKTFNGPLNRCWLRRTSGSNFVAETDSQYQPPFGGAFVVV